MLSWQQFFMLIFALYTRPAAVPVNKQKTIQVRNFRACMVFYYLTLSRQMGVDFINTHL